MPSPNRTYILLLSTIVLVVFCSLAWYGFGYYTTPLDQRFFHAANTLLKPSGFYGHGYGIAGSLCLIAGVGLYMARKRIRALSRLGVLRHWLEFHIFLCTLGPILVLYHTAFKFGGLVAVSFWSMVAVFLSGIAGRFIYLQIPKSIEGRELNLAEVQAMKTNLGEVLSGSYQLDAPTLELITDSTMKRIGVYHSNPLSGILAGYIRDRKTLGKVRAAVRHERLSRPDRNRVLALVKHEISLNRRIDRLEGMQRLFKYWHVAHLPFAIVMLIIMVIHVAVTIVFGYRWIF
jgi:hypothetical protein